jgi:hypothetical protein
VKPPRLGVWRVCGPRTECILFPGICLTTEENHGKPQSGYTKGARLINAERDSFNRLGHRWRWLPLARWAHTALCFRVRRRGQPSVSVSICRVAVLGDSPHQANLCRSSQSGLICGRQGVEQTDPRVSACYLRTRGTSSKAKTLGLQHL